MHQFDKEELQVLEDALKEICLRYNNRAQSNYTPPTQVPYYERKLEVARQIRQRLGFLP